MPSLTLLSLQGRRLRLKNSQAAVMLTASQRDLIQCVIEGVNDKAAIIDRIWGADHKSGNGNNLSQLVFRLKNDLRRSGFPPDLLMVSRQSIYIDGKYLQADSGPCPFKSKKLNDPGIFIYL
ncbi:hypothetical protein ACED16_15410 [Enterobacter hormaechei]